MARSYELVPQDVARVETKYRRIVTKFPVPESIPLLEDLRKAEPVSMQGQPIVVWDHAEGFQVFDQWGNKWLDFSSGVLVANVGHGRREVIDAICQTAQKGLLTHYCFPGAPRRDLAKLLVSIAPKELNKAFILSTGAETTECAVKLGKQHGQKISPEKVYVISFEGAFHGRTMGAQLIGGTPALKTWIGKLDPTFVQVPFPDGWRNPDTSFAGFEKALATKGIKPQQVCLVIQETYQGGNGQFTTPEYAQALRKWCDKYQVVLCYDEVQAGFGRTGKMFGFEHYGVVPDLTTLGKGISSSLPISAILGKQELMDQFPPGSMTSTHTGNPVCSAAAVASIKLLLKEKLVDNAAKVGAVMKDRLCQMSKKHSDVVGPVMGKGLICGVHFTKPGTKEPDGDLAWEVVRKCVQSGVLLFSTVGLGGGTIKVNPPLIITEEAVLEGCEVIEKSLEAVLASR
jgi:4-aminobutyrate aminotransferase / (S)-3-amino-2-methylpropionate transaminase / 5-aminovalerate transaminase